MTVEHSGGGPAERSLASLWRGVSGAGAEPRRGRGGEPTLRRPSGEPSRGRPPRVTLDEIVAAATAVADAEGLAAMSMHRVAKSLGVGTMTLYHYVPSKDELLDLVVDQALAERELPGPGAPRPDGWRAQITLYAERTRALFQRHRWLRQVSMVRPTLGPGMMAGREYVLSALSGIGLTPRQVSDAASTISAFVDAAVALQVETDQLERDTGMSQNAWWDERELFWEKYFDMERYPAMVTVWESGGFDYADAAEETAAAYGFGLDRLLDGIQVLIDANRS